MHMRLKPLTTLLLLLVIGAALWTAPAQAQLWDWTGEGQAARVDLRVRQDIDVGYARTLTPKSEIQDIGNEWVVEPTLNYSYLDWIRLKVDVAPWGDAAYFMRRPGGNFGGPNEDIVHGRQGVFVPYSPASNKLAAPDECFFGDCRNFLRDYLLREASVTVSNREGGYNITLGKFQRGWGQADGLRLMDVINPLDFRKRFLLSNFDELRIGQWMGDFTVFPDAWVNLDRFGIHNPNAEFIWIPNVRHDEFRINNAFDHTGGGVWGFNLPTREITPNGPLPDRVHAHFTYFPADRNSWWSWTNPALAGRLAWRTFGADLTLNGYYGRQELFITHFDSLDLCGKIDGTGCFAHLPGPTAVAALNPARPPEAQRTKRLFNINSLCDIGGPFCAPGGIQSAVANIDFQYPYRRLVGFTLTRELSFLRLPPKDVSPVLRVESTYEFQKAFNKVDLINVDSVSQARHDFWSTLVGFDYFLYLPQFMYGNFFFSRPEGIFTSAQVFFFKVLADGSGVNQVLWQAPYVAWKRPHDGEYWFTFLWFTDVERDLIHLEGLNIYDLAHNSFILRQRIDFNYFGDHIKPRLEVGYLEGHSDVAGGLFKRSSYVDTALTYQF